MSREVRRVPETWQHPKDSNGRYIPLFDGFTKALQEWEKGKEMWDKGFRDNFQGGWIPLNPNPPEMAFEEWQGMKPVLGILLEAVETDLPEVLRIIREVQV